MTRTWRKVWTEFDQKKANDLLDGNFRANLVQLEVTDCSLDVQHLLHSDGDLVKLFAIHLISELFKFRAQRVAAA